MDLEEGEIVISDISSDASDVGNRRHGTIESIPRKRPRDSDRYVKHQSLATFTRSSDTTGLHHCKDMWHSSEINRSKYGQQTISRELTRSNEMFCSRNGPFSTNNQLNFSYRSSKKKHKKKSKRNKIANRTEQVSRGKLNNRRGNCNAMQTTAVDARHAVSSTAAPGTSLMNKLIVAGLAKKPTAISSGAKDIITIDLSDSDNDANNLADLKNVKKESTITETNIGEDDPGSDDSEIEVIIPPKKVPLVVTLYSDEEAIEDGAPGQNSLESNAAVPENMQVLGSVENVIIPSQDEKERHDVPTPPSNAQCDSVICLDVEEVEEPYTPSSPSSCSFVEHSNSDVEARSLMLSNIDNTPLAPISPVEEIQTFTTRDIVDLQDLTLGTLEPSFSRVNSDEPFADLFVAGRIIPLNNDQAHKNCVDALFSSGETSAVLQHTSKQKDYSNNHHEEIRCGIQELDLNISSTPDKSRSVHKASDSSPCSFSLVKNNTKRSYVEGETNLDDTFSETNNFTNKQFNAVVQEVHELVIPSNIEGKARDSCQSSHDSDIVVCSRESVTAPVIKDSTDEQEPYSPSSNYSSEKVKEDDLQSTSHLERRNEQPVTINEGLIDKLALTVYFNDESADIINASQNSVTLNLENNNSTLSASTSVISTATKSINSATNNISSSNENKSSTPYMDNAERMSVVHDNLSNDPDQDYSNDFTPTTAVISTENNPIVNSGKSQESIFDNSNEQTSKSDDEDDLSQLRLIALSTKRKLNENLSTSKENVISTEVVQTNPTVCNDDYDNEEEDVLQLRVAALKSAVMKKHAERKKRGLVVKKRKHVSSSVDDIPEILSLQQESDTTDSPPVPVEPYLQDQGEEDMEIADSDSGEDIIQDVDIQQTQVKNVPNVCWKPTDMSNTTNPPLPVCESFPDTILTYSNLPKSIIASQLLPPGVPDFSSNCVSGQSQSYSSTKPYPPVLPPPPPPPALVFSSLTPPPPPPPPIPITAAESQQFHVPPITKPLQSNYNSLTDYNSPELKSTQLNSSYDTKNHVGPVFVSSISSQSSSVISSSNYPADTVERNLVDKKIDKFYSSEYSTQFTESLNDQNSKSTLLYNQVKPNLRIIPVVKTNTKQNLRIIPVVKTNTKKKLTKKKLQNKLNQMNRWLKKVNKNKGKRAPPEPKLLCITPSSSKFKRKVNLTFRPQHKFNFQCTTVPTTPLCLADSHTVETAKPRSGQNQKTSSSLCNKTSDIVVNSLDDYDQKETAFYSQSRFQYSYDSDSLQGNLPGQEDDMDLSNMIVIDEVGMSPEEKSQCDQYWNYSSLQEDDEDENTLRVRALTTLSSKPASVKSIYPRPHENREHFKVVRNEFGGSSVGGRPLRKIKNFENISVTQRVDVSDSSKFRLTRVIVNEPRRSIVQAKESIKVTIPTEQPPPQYLLQSQPSPPVVDKFVISVGQDSDSEEDCEWMRKVRVQESQEVPPGPVVDLELERSVDLLLMNTRQNVENRPLVKTTQVQQTSARQSTQKPVQTWDEDCDISETPLRLLPKEKQEEYQRLKKIIEEKEKQKKLAKKLVTNKQTKNTTDTISVQEENVNKSKKDRSTSPVEEQRDTLVQNGSSKIYSNISVVESQRYKKEFISHDHDYDFPRKIKKYNYIKKNVNTSGFVSNPPYKNAIPNQEPDYVSSKNHPDVSNTTKFKSNVQKYLGDFITKCNSKKYTEKEHVESSSIENFSETSDDGLTETSLLAEWGKSDDAATLTESEECSVPSLKYTQGHSSCSPIANTVVGAEDNECRDRVEVWAEDVRMKNVNNSEQHNCFLDSVPKKTKPNENEDIEVLEIIETSSEHLETRSRSINEDIVNVIDVTDHEKGGEIETNEAIHGVHDSDLTPLNIETNEVVEVIDNTCPPIQNEVVEVIDNTYPPIQNEAFKDIDNNDPSVQINEAVEVIDNNINVITLKAVESTSEANQHIIPVSTELPHSINDNLIDVESHCSESSHTLLSSGSSKLLNENLENVTVDQDLKNNDSCSSAQYTKRRKTEAVKEQFPSSSSVVDTLEVAKKLKSNRDLIFEMRYNFAEELAHMFESLKDLEQEQIELDKVVIEISTLRKALRMAEERLHHQYTNTSSLDQKVHTTQQSMYDQHLHIQQLENTSQENQMFTSGKDMIFKKIQQISQKKDKINSKRKVLKEYLQNPNISKEEFVNIYNKHNPENNNCETIVGEVLNSSLLELPDVFQITSLPREISSNVLHSESSKKNEIIPASTLEISQKVNVVSNEVLTGASSSVFSEKRKGKKRSSSPGDNSPTFGNKKPNLAENKSSCDEQERVNHPECLNSCPVDVGEKRVEENGGSKPTDFSVLTNEAVSKPAKSLLTYKSVRPNSTEEFLSQL